jgi:flagellar hook-associated protein 3 FlgL
MSIRVNPNVAPDLLSDLQIIQQQQNQADLQVASGRSINSPSDNPAGAADLVINSAQSSQVDQFQQNITNLETSLQIGDSTMSSVVEAFTQAISLGVQGGNSNYSSADLEAIAQQVSGIRNQILGLANTSSEGVYLFSGTEPGTQPYGLDPTSADGVSYSGNNAANSVEVSNGQMVQINIPGSQVFSNSAGDVFGALNQLISALQSGTGIDAANSAMDQAFNVLNTQRLFFGNTLSQVQQTSSFLSTEQLQLSTQANQIDSANMAAATTDLAQTDLASQTLLQAAGKTLGLPSLLNYIQ